LRRDSGSGFDGGETGASRGGWDAAPAARLPISWLPSQYPSQKNPVNNIQSSAIPATSPRVFGLVRAGESIADWILRQIRPDFHG